MEMEEGESSQANYSPHVLVVSSDETDRINIASEFKILSWTVTETDTVEKASRILNLENSDPSSNKMRKIDIVCIHPSDSLVDGEILFDRITCSPSTMNLPIVVIFMEDDDPETMQRFSTKGAVVIDSTPFSVMDMEKLEALLSLPDKGHKSDHDSDN